MELIYSKRKWAGCFEVKGISWVHLWGGFNPKGNFFSPLSLSFLNRVGCISCSLLPLCLSAVGEVHAFMSKEVVALCSLEPRSKMSQKHPKDFTCCSCQGKYVFWNGNSETIHRVPGMIKKKKTCPKQYIQAWTLNTHTYLGQSTNTINTDGVSLFLSGEGILFR